MPFVMRCGLRDRSGGLLNVCRALWCGVAAIGTQTQTVERGEVVSEKRVSVSVHPAALSLLPAGPRFPVKRPWVCTPPLTYPSCSCLRSSGGRGPNCANNRGLPQLEQPQPRPQPRPEPQPEPQPQLEPELLSGRRHLKWGDTPTPLG